MNLSKAIFLKGYKILPRVQLMTDTKMTSEEFTGVTFNDLDLSGTRDSRSSYFCVVNTTEIALSIPQKAHIL